ncbi:MAG: class I SAM-dependent RNA methyltransferase [Actinobacteria bacterium]|nr:class I SAM-dependent RNA methyltransferase [Actinomycetota bacterium]MBV8959429.1 class I SAM-dependent RNA methyltransferase [Actinomycetota bacterium]MBV9253689.1 class I SAM-dependent RNA methyltransferase [Actinomycetota bacterium]MBV9665603.1 class I SAM-dependent RNA methyltransferase [Actinomycetota bacterium]MBV9934085.1 class I SAM-dependent RNA methyltransferase [Actinomycetota bacterium]
MKPVELQTTGIAAGGDAIAREEDGRVVFVAGALPGERVRVELVEERRDFARGRVLDVVDASPARVAPPCPELMRGCGGCGWQHVELGAQRELKAQIISDALHRIGKLDEPPMRPAVELPADGYRTTVRAAVRGGRGGYRKARSHAVRTVDSCLVAHPLISDLLVNGRYGRANEVTLRCGARTGERMAAPHPTDARIDVPADVRRDHITEEVAGRRWRVSARSFFQARPDGADALVGLVRAAAGDMPAPGRALDLYSGVGLFAGALADDGWNVTAVEGSSSAVADARVNLAADTVDVVHADVTAWEPSPADLVVADPSRTGLAAAGVHTVTSASPTRVVLVSCDPAALARDAALLVTAGYRLTAVTPVDLFPHTPHVEAVSVFDR